MRGNYCQFRQWDLRRRLEHTRIAQMRLWEFQEALIQHWHCWLQQEAFDTVEILTEREYIAVTMPGFGTTDRTYTKRSFN